MDRFSPRSDSPFQLELPPNLQQEVARKPKPQSPFPLSLPSLPGTVQAKGPLIQEESLISAPRKISDDDSVWTRALGLLGSRLEGPPSPSAWETDIPAEGIQVMGDAARSIVTGTSELLAGEWLGNPDKTYEAFASGDRDKISQAIDGLVYDLSFLGFDVMTGKGVQMIKALSPILEMTKKEVQALSFQPRQTYRKLQQIIPGWNRLDSVREGAWEIVSYPFKKGFIPTTEGKKSIADIMQPAVERLEKGGLDVPFRRSTANKAITTGMGKELGEAAAKLGPQERYQLYKALRGLPADAAQTKMLWDWRAKVLGKGVEQEYAKAFRHSLGKRMAKQFDLTNDQLFNLPQAESFIKTLDDNMQGVFKPREVQKVFKEAIEDVNTPMELKLLAKDLYNLPYSTPAAVGEASKQASTAFLVNNLKRVGVVKDQLPKGAVLGEDWWISRYPKLKGAYVPRDVELELRAIQDIPKYTRGWFNRVFLTPWKTGKVILRPATHIRNMFSNVILNDWGGLPFYRADVYMKAALEMKNKGKMWREWEQMSGAGGTFSVAEVEQVTGGMKYGSNLLDHSLSVFDRMTAVPRHYYNLEEQWFKLAKYMHNRSQGLQKYEAALDAMKWTFNYGEITRSTAAIRGTVAPFFTWTSKVMPLMAETAVKHPLRFGKWIMMYQGFQNMAIQQTNLSNDEWSWLHGILPDYVREGAFLLMPFRDSKDRLQLMNLSYIIPGLGDMTDISRDPSGQLIGSPLISIGGALRDNVKYSGAPIWYDWEPGMTKFAKASAFLWESLMPGIVPGGTDFQQVYDTITERPDAMTWGQIAAAQAGLRVTPIDPEQMARRREALDDIHRAEIGMQMRKELRRARSSEEASRIVEQYGLLRQRLEEKVSQR